RRCARPLRGSLAGRVDQPAPGCGRRRRQRAAGLRAIPGNHLFGTDGNASRGSSVMIASLRAESLKTRKRWANWILFAILLAWIVLLSYLTFYLVIRLSPHSIQGPVPASVLKRRLFPENFVPTVLNAAESIGAAIMLIFGALSTASEYGWLTVQTILIQKPTRSAVLGGKLLGAGITAVVVSLALLGVTALSSYVVVTIDSSSSSWPSWEVMLKAFGALVLQFAVCTSLGAFVGIAFRSAAAAIGGGLVYLF